MGAENEEGKEGDWMRMKNLGKCLERQKSLFFENLYDNWKSKIRTSELLYCKIIYPFKRANSCRTLP